MKTGLIVAALAMLLVPCLVSCDARLRVPDVTVPYAGSSEVVTVPTGKAKVIILSGQSNAAGVAWVNTLSEEEQARYAAGFPDICISVTNELSGNDSEGFVTTTTGWGDSKGRELFGPEVGLAEQLGSDYSGETLYIIKYSWSGAGLEDKFLPGRPGFNALCRAIDNGLADLRSQGLDPEIVAFCWMQGESDSPRMGTALRYEANQRSMVSSLRSRYGSFFFMDAGISSSYLWKYYARINNAKCEMDCLLDRCVFINSNYHGLVVSQSDPAHYDAPSMIKLGHLFGQQIAEHIITGE